jgi:hypothetical protein
MADAVSSQTLVNNERNLVMKFTNTSDGTGESAVLKVDVSALGATIVKIKRVHYSVAGMVARLLWDATTDVTILDLQGDGDFDCSSFGGLINNAGTGVTGDILLTTIGHTSGDSYSIILEMQKS